MKLISFTKSNFTFLLYSLLYLLIMLLLNFASSYLQNLNKNMEEIAKKIPLMLLINHFFLSFCIFEKVIKSKKKTEKKAIHNQNIIDENQSRKDLIYNAPENDVKILTNKKLVLFFSMFILDYFYNASLMYYQKKYEENTDLVFSQIYKFLDVLFLLLLFKLFEKIQFYKHQYISLSIIIISGLGNFFIRIFFEEKINNEMTNKIGLMTFIFLIGCPFIDSIKIYYFKRLMNYYFISPPHIGYLMGFFHLIISAVLMTIFYFVDFDNSDIKKFFSIKVLEFPNVIEIALLIGYSLLYSFEYMMDLIIINRFTPFHLILLVTFGELISEIFHYFKNTVDFTTVEFIFHVSLYAFEIIGILIFIETIILKCCGLDKYTKKNIIFRGEEDMEQLGKDERTSSYLSEEKEMDENDNNGIH